MGIVKFQSMWRQILYWIQSIPINALENHNRSQNQLPCNDNKTQVSNKIKILIEQRKSWNQGNVFTDFKTKEKKIYFLFWLQARMCNFEGDMDIKFELKKRVEGGMH